MDVVCKPAADFTPEEASCPCRPAYHLEGIQLEHATLGLAQLAKAAYLLWWLRSQQRRTVSEPNSLLVLPVYARFLTFEARSCMVWGLFYLGQAVYEVVGLDQMPRVASMALQLVRYGSAFTWALCGEGVFLFLCFSSAGAESLRAAIRLGALWATLLLTICALLWLNWAGCSTPPGHPLLQMLWVGAWLPFWMRMLLMLPLYLLAVAALAARETRDVTWARGALPLALFELSSALLFLLPKLALGVFTRDLLRWQVRPPAAVAPPTPAPWPPPT